MPDSISDVIVIGLGGMGSSAAMHLALEGAKVLGLEQFSPNHDLGSSHGSTRAIRLAYYENPNYVPLLKRSYHLWHDLEWRVGETLLEECGCLSVGHPNHEVIQGIIASSALHSLDVDFLTHGQLAEKYGFLNLPENYVGAFEKLGGYLWVDRCVRAFQKIASDLKAGLHFDTPVTSIQNVGKDIKVITPGGNHLARKVIITAGPWAANLIGAPGKCLSLMRQTTHWFMPENPGDFFRDKVPVFMVADQEGFFYGFPMVDPEGVKVARHYGQAEVHHPDEIIRGMLPEDEAALRVFLNRRIPALANAKSPLGKTCIYTLSPDRHFMVGPLPENPNILVGTGFSGHGFKFASVMGEILSQLACNQQVPLNIEFLNLGRFLNDNNR